MTPEQCRMARGALNWTVRRLAREVRMAYNTIHTFERGESVREETVLRLQDVFTARGVRFGAGDTVTLLKASA